MPDQCQEPPRRYKKCNDQPKQRPDCPLIKDRCPPEQPPKKCCRPKAKKNESADHHPAGPPGPPTAAVPSHKMKKKRGPFDLTDEQKALVMDNYYPGLIHDAVNQYTDFNEVAKRFVTPETAVDGDKTEKGMSLIEAFDTRVKIEQSTLKSLITTVPDKAAAAAETSYQPVYGPSPHPVVSDVVLEESVRASVIPVDLQQYVRVHPESDPVRAISCLSRAQKLNDYYKEYRGAQIAANQAPPDKIEQAAIFGAKSFQIESLSSEHKSVDSNFYKPLELVSYIGITKPNP